MFVGVAAFGGAGKGMNARKMRMNAHIVAVTPDQTSTEMRAQFLSRSTPTPVKIPRIARPKKKTTVPSAMARARLGNGGPAFELGSVRTAKNPKAVPSSTSTLPTMATTPAAVTDAVGPRKVFTIVCISL